MEPRLTPPKETEEEKIERGYREEYATMDIRQLIWECEVFGLDIHSVIIDELVNYRKRKWEVK